MKAVIVVCLLLISTLVTASPAVHFNVPLFPPYAYEENGEIKGIAVDAVKSIFEQANIQYKLTLTASFARALHNVKTRQADGFFLATQSSERDTVATFSQPVLLNRWSWFVFAGSAITPRHPDFKQLARIGSIAGTNTAIWLTKNHYKVNAQPSDVDTLVKMFVHHRANVVFLSETVFEQALTRAGINSHEYEKYIEVTRPFGIYIGHHAQLVHPDIVIKINQAIGKLGYPHSAK